MIETFEMVYTPDDPAELDDAPRLQAVLWQKSMTHLAAIAHGQIAKSVAFSTVKLHGSFVHNDVRMHVRVEWIE